MKQIKYYLFCMKWLWKNRTWANTRQKWKQMEKDYEAKHGPTKIYKGGGPMDE